MSSVNMSAIRCIYVDLADFTHERLHTDSVRRVSLDDNSGQYLRVYFAKMQNSRNEGNCADNNNNNNNTKFI